MLRPQGGIADNGDGPSGDDLTAALRLIAIATRRGLLRLDYGGRIATAFVAREGDWDEAYARRLIDRLVADGRLGSTRRG